MCAFHLLRAWCFGRWPITVTRLVGSLAAIPSSCNNVHVVGFKRDLLECLHSTSWQAEHLSCVVILDKQKIDLVLSYLTSRKLILCCHTWLDTTTWQSMRLPLKRDCQSASRFGVSRCRQDWLSINTAKQCFKNHNKSHTCRTCMILSDEL